jgi:hypothetical protein
MAKRLALNASAAQMSLSFTGVCAASVRHRSVRPKIGAHRHKGARNAIKKVKISTRLADNSPEATAPK